MPESAKPELTEQNEVNKDHWSISLPKTRIHTLEQLIEYFEIDLAIWEVERFVANKWEVGRKDQKMDWRVVDGVAIGYKEDSGTIFVEPLFQVKAFLKKKVNIVDARKEIEELRKLAKKDARIPKEIKRAGAPSGNMLELCIYDHHWGKLAWGEQTGHDNYDVKIATEIFNKAFNSLLDRTAGLVFDEIWFAVGNDLLNSDDTQGRTTHGTYVATDIRYQKTFKTVRLLITDAIERLRRRAKKVKVIMVSGNHDNLSVWHLGDSLECVFAKYKDVEIDNSPLSYKCHQFGKVMLMFAHGDKGKHEDYPLLMATEHAKMFGETAFREVHTGHTHQLKTTEKHGIRVRILPALCSPDAWHAQNGYVGNLRSSEAFIWNKNEGLIGTAIYTDQDERQDEKTR
jgi:hypothetical protein